MGERYGDDASGSIGKVVGRCKKVIMRRGRLRRSNDPSTTAPLFQAFSHNCG